MLLVRAHDPLDSFLFKDPQFRICFRGVLEGMEPQGGSSCMQAASTYTNEEQKPI